MMRLIDGMEDLLIRALGPENQIARRLAEDLGRAKVDGNQLELALLNLAVNARDAMPSGGVVTIAAANDIVSEKDPRIRLSPGPYIRISVIDTGVGMDQATLAKATDPFFTTKGPNKGTGLGLSMVYGLAAQSGGAIGITSKVGAGTTVDLWLPRAEDDDAASRISPEESREAARLMLPPCTVLVVDDDVLVAAGTTSLLEDLGHSVIEAHSGAEALRLLELGGRPDLVITDYAMPGMTGFELARAIGEKYPTLPVVLASGYAEFRCGALDGSALPRLAKPFRQDELLAAMAEAASWHERIRLADC